jgi:hypothetical protein
MNAMNPHVDQFPKPAATGGAPTQPTAGRPDKQQQFRALIEPIFYRARQLGLNRVQIREIILSLL